MCFTPDFRMAAAVAALCFCITASTASAFVSDPNPGKYRSVTSGAWRDPNTWQVNNSGHWDAAREYPSAGDTATIREEHCVRIDSDVTVKNLTIDCDGEVDIGYGTLTVTGKDGLELQGSCDSGITADICILNSGTLQLTGGGIHLIDGRILLKTGSSTLLINTNDSTLLGDGYVEGRSATASIRIGANRKLTNRTLIQGELVIDRVSGTTGTATFSNARIASTAEGIIRANATNGSSGSYKVLELGANLILDDDMANGYRPVYEANGNNYSQLKFSREADGNPDPRLEGDFVMLSCSDFVMDQNIWTNGGFTPITSSGTLDVAPNVCFLWGPFFFLCTDTTFSGGGSCP